MKKVIVFILFFFLTLVTLAEQNNYSPKSFSGKTLEGKIIRLSNYKNKIVLLDFWASWCPPCRKEMPELIKLYNKHKNENFVIIAVNIDDKSENMKKFIRELFPKPIFPMIWDSLKVIPPRYNIDSMPTTIMLDKTGKERFRHNGFKLDYIKEFESEFQILKREK